MTRAGRHPLTEQRAVDDLVRSLTDKFPTLSPETVRTTVQKAHDGFDDCRIRDYLTVLTEKAVTVELTAASRNPPPSS